MLKNNLKTYTFIDGDFSMDIKVSEEERTVYMSQNKVAILLEISGGTVSKYIKKLANSKWDSVSEMEQNSNKTFPSVSTELEFETIKEIGQKYNPERIEKLEKWLVDLLPENELEIIDGDYEIVRYNQDNLNVPIRIERATNSMWMTQKEIADLFETTIQNVGQHISNIFEEKELENMSVVKKNFITASDGKTYETSIYNIDMILSIGYRIKTSKARAFRLWSNEILKRNIDAHFDYAINGYPLLNRDLASIVADNQDLRARVNKLEESFAELKPTTWFFSKDHAYNAYITLSIFISFAHNEVFVIDPYLDRFTFSLLDQARSDVNIVLVGSSKGNFSNEELELLERGNRKIEVIKDNDVHGRYIFVDRRYGYMLDQSPNSISYYDFGITSVDDITVIKQIIHKYKNT